MNNNQYDMFPIPVFIVSAKSGRIIFVNHLAQEKGIQINAAFIQMLTDKSLFSKLVKDQKPVRIKSELIIDKNHFLSVIDINNIEFEGEASLLMLLSSMEHVSLLSEQETIQQICEAYLKNEKNPLYDFLRITAQSVSAYCAALYEMKNGRYAIRDEWRERKCVCVPMLSADFDDYPEREMTRLKSLKRAQDMVYLSYQKKHGTKGVVLYFFDIDTDSGEKDRISKYIDVYRVLAPDAPPDNFAAINKGLERTEQGMAIWDADSKELIFQNKMFREKFGTGSAQLLTNKLPKDFKPGAGPSLVYSDTAGRSYCISHTKVRLGRRKLITTVIFDITRYKKAETRLEMLAKTDVLTGLNNRRAGLEILEESYSRCKKDGKPLTVCFADIDGLKKINDTYGHSVGDNIIRSVAGILKKQLNGAGHACRLGGDEFVLIMPGQTKDQAMMLASRIEKAVDRCFLNDSKAISVSFGFKEADYSAGETSSTLLKIADFDMYSQKQSKA